MCIFFIHKFTYNISHNTTITSLLMDLQSTEHKSLTEILEQKHKSDFIISSVSEYLSSGKYHLVDAIFEKYDLTKDILAGIYKACEKEPSKKQHILEYIKSKKFVVGAHVIFLFMKDYNYDFFLELVETDVLTFNKILVDEDLFSVVEYTTVKLNYNDTVGYHVLNSLEEIRTVVKCLTSLAKIILNKYKVFFSELKYSRLIEYLGHYSEKFKNIGLSEFYDIGLVISESDNEEDIPDIIRCFYHESRHDLFLKHIQFFFENDLYESFLETLSTSEEFIDSMYSFLYKKNITVNLRRLVYNAEDYKRRKHLLKHIYSIYIKKNNHILDKDVGNVVVYKDDETLCNSDVDLLEHLFTNIYDDDFNYEELETIPIKVLKKYITSSNKITIFKSCLHDIYAINMFDYNSVDDFVEELLQYTTVQYDDTSYGKQYIVSTIKKRSCIENILQKNISSVVYGYLCDM